MGRPVVEVTAAGVRTLVVVIQWIDREKKIVAHGGSEKKIPYNKALCETHLCYTPSQLKESRLAKP